MPTTCKICGRPLKVNNGIYSHVGVGRLDHRAVPVRDYSELKGTVHDYLDSLPDGSFIKASRLTFSLGLPATQGNKSLVGRAIAEYSRSNVWGRNRPAAYILEG